MTSLIGRRRAALLFALVAASLGSACMRVRVNRGGSESASSDAIAAITRVATEFSARYMRGDAAGMAAIYTDDGVIFPGGRPAIRGRPAIEAYWRLPANERVTMHKVTADSVVVRGDIAYDYGTFMVSGERDGKPWGPSHGKYVIVWREVSAGDWRMHLDIWNSSPAPTP